MRENKVSKFVYWTPRVLSIIFLAFLALFSLDVFDAELNFWQTLLALFMHNIPVLVLLSVLIISWKREIVGAIVFILAGILYAILAISGADNLLMVLAWIAQISGVAFIIGGFFLANWLKKRKYFFYFLDLSLQFCFFYALIIYRRNTVNCYLT